jgi:hypothetical protein
MPPDFFQTKSYRLRHPVAIRRTRHSIRVMRHEAPSAVDTIVRSTHVRLSSLLLSDSASMSIADYQFAPHSLADEKGTMANEMPGDVTNLLVSMLPKLTARVSTTWRHTFDCPPPKGRWFDNGAISDLARDIHHVDLETAPKVYDALILIRRKTLVDKISIMTKPKDMPLGRSFINCSDDAPVAASASVASSLTR